MVLCVDWFGSSFLRQNFDGQDGKVVLTNDDFSSIFADILLGLVDLQGGNVDDVHNNNLAVGAKVF